MARTRKLLQQKAWDALNAQYASLDYPEWVSTSRLPMYFWTDEHNHRRYISWLGRKLGYTKPEDWYQITVEDFLSNRGTSFLEYYDGSPSAVVLYHFPNDDWKPWLFGQVPIGFWQDLNNCLAFAKWFEEQREFKSIEGWYEITQNDVFELHGAGLLGRFECSVQRFVAAVYPDYPWLPWLFIQVPKNFWGLKDNRIAYLKWLESQLGYTKPQDWYQVSKHDFKRNQGASLMHYGYKTVELIRELYPHLEWQPWMFHQVYQGYWNQKANRLDYLKWLGKQLGFSSAEDWVHLKRRDFKAFFGVSLIQEYYANSLDKAIQERFPGRSFHPWEYSQVPPGYWDEPENCRNYLDWLGERLGFTRTEDWYQVRREDFRQNNGNGFIKRFKKPYFGLQIAYPDVQWLPWCFETVPVGFWDTESNRQWYLSWLGQQLDFRSPSDWLGITAIQLRAFHGNGLIKKMSVREIGIAGVNLCHKK